MIFSIVWKLDVAWWQGDGAAVMAESVRNIYSNHPKFNVELIAIVSPVTQKMLPLLKALGFKILVRDVPVKVEELQNPTFKAKAPTSGCCGLAELLKLEAWTLVCPGDPDIIPIGFEGLIC